MQLKLQLGFGATPSTLIKLFTNRKTCTFFICPYT